MPERKKEIYDPKEVFLYRLFAGYIFGIVAIMGIWLLSGLLFVVFKT